MYGFHKKLHCLHCCRHCYFHCNEIFIMREEIKSDASWFKIIELVDGFFGITKNEIPKM